MKVYEYECENENCDNKQWSEDHKYSLDGMYCGEHRDTANDEGGKFRYNRTLTKEETSDHLDDEELLSKAVREAKKRFNEVIEEEGLDPAYFSIDLQGYQLSVNFTNYRHSVEMYDQERKEEVEE